MGLPKALGGQVGSIGLVKSRHREGRFNALARRARRSVQIERPGYPAAGGEEESSAHCAPLFTLKGAGRARQGGRVMVLAVSHKALVDDWCR